MAKKSKVTKEKHRVQTDKVTTRSMWRDGKWVPVERHEEIVTSIEEYKS